MLTSILLKKIVLPIADFAMKTSISSSRRTIKKLRKLSKDQLISWQEDRLRKLIHHAYTKTTYYSTLLNELNIKPDEIRTITDLEKIPVLTKEIIRKNYNNLRAVNIEDIPHQETSTGGSSGDPLRYLLDNNSWSFTVANTIINWEKTKYKYGNKFVALGSSSLLVDNKTSFKHKIYYILKNKVSLNGINMSDSVCKEYTDIIRCNNIKYIYGYATSIYLLAKYCKSHGVNIKINCCFTTSEMLTVIYRETIKDAFSCEIMDCYGANDGGITAFSLKSGVYEVGYNCVFNLQDATNEGASEIVITDLFNYAMPIINYKLGDIIEINKNQNTDYTYNGQLFNKIVGRSSEILQLENGSILTGPGFTILFKDMPVEYYLIEKIACDSIKCSVKRLPEFSEKHSEIIYTTFRKHIGPNSKFSLVYIDQINYLKNGKKEYFRDSTILL